MLVTLWGPRVNSRFEKVAFDQLCVILPFLLFNFLNGHLNPSHSP